jgi:hypothetical protein
LAKFDKKMILDSVGDICNSLGVEGAIGKAIAEITLNKYNPEKAGMNKADDSAMFSIKKLIRAAFPSFPVEIMDSLFQIVAEKDPSAMFDILEEMNIPTPMFKTAHSFLMKKPGMLEESMLQMTQEILP